MKKKERELSRDYETEFSQQFPTNKTQLRALSCPSTM